MNYFQIKENFLISSLLNLHGFSSFISEICQQLEVLQLDFSNAEAVSTACVYLVDPHKLPGSAKDAADNANGRESNADDGIPQHCFHYKRTSEQDQSDENYQVDDMSISSDSDFEETLQNHFQYTPGPKSGEKSDKNDDSFTDFVPSLKQQYVNDIISVSVAFTESFKSNTSFSRKENPSLQNVTENISISSSRSPNSKRRKRRKTNNRFNGSSPVEQFSNSSLISSTPLSTKPDNGTLFFILTSNFYFFAFTFCVKP